MRISARTAAAYSVAAVLVVICYCLVDRPVAWFLYEHAFFPRRCMSWAVTASDAFKHVAGAMVVVVVAWRLWRRAGRLQTVLLALAADLVAATAAKSLLKWIFGRYWPYNPGSGHPSLLADGSYGFNPFHYGGAYESFPSGHAVLLVSLGTVLWLAYPRLRWLTAAACLTVCVLLVALNFHFVSDVIAGAMVGIAVGYCIAGWFGIAVSKREQTSNVPLP